MRVCHLNMILVTFFLSSCSTSLGPKVSNNSDQVVIQLGDRGNVDTGKRVITYYESWGGKEESPGKCSKNELSLKKAPTREVGDEAPDEFLNLYYALIEYSKELREINRENIAAYEEWLQKCE